jgi:cell division protein FtsQ
MRSFVFKRKKPRKNHRKGAGRKQRFVFLRRFMICFYGAAGLAALMATSCLFILTYDIITQCDYFKANRLEIEGMQRLTAKQIVEVARVKKGMNILSANLSMARKRLLAHPWIAEAEVRREIPSGLYIRVREHKPLAIIDLDRKYIMNEQGRIFKEWAESDPDNLPLVSGLQLADIRVQDRTGFDASPHSAGRLNLSSTERPRNLPYEAVMQVLRLGKQARGVLSNRNIKQIRVDREIGITLETFKQMKTIVLGYRNFPLKYGMLENILTYGRHRRGFPDFDRIDLNNVNRIVVNPVSRVPAGDHKEV